MRALVGLTTVLAIVTLVTAPGWTVGSGGGRYGSSDEDTSTQTESLSDLEKGERLLAKEDWSEAITLFEKVVDEEPDNADAWNYLAFSHRKQGDLDTAFDYYGKALELDPEHLGANEYLGEAYLQVDDMEGALAQLAKLEELCGAECEEYQLLSDAIDDYKAQE